ncbi:unnamed protein product [Paramecium sonneborni]|uniref:Uncharacterized protein n=1 Tax=Paramecium sonneborni TaxID=65129 RepID=A0A8S1KQ83_9CILI|nr:unnamed protein product [Paramecium sonneborni]
MESEFIISKKESQIFPDIIDNCSDFPAVIKKAELIQNLQGISIKFKKMQLLQVYKDHIQYKLCDKLNDD